MERVDVAIIGCGPAGLSAAINAKWRGKEVVLFGTKLCSPALHKAHQIDNYLGFPAMAGEDLRQRFLEHAESMGIKPELQTVSAAYPMSGYFELQLRNDNLQVTTLVLATGVAVARPLPGEEKYIGRGISYCATCDGNFYRGKVVAVISEDAHGEEEALFLASLAEKVYYLPLYAPVGRLPENVEIVDDKPAEFSGGDRLEKLELKSGKSLDIDGCFVLKEQLPLTQLVPGLELADRHIKVDRRMATNIPGLFAAGDVAGRPYQLAKAVAEGQLAALSAVSYIDSQKK